LKPEDTYTLLLLAKVYRDKKEYKGALKCLKRANDLTGSGHPSALFEMAMIYSEMQEFGNALNLFKRIDKLSINYEGPDEGLTIYKRIYEPNKKDPSFLQGYAYLYYLRRDYKNTIKYFLNSLKIDKSEFRCNYALGMSFFYTGEFGKATEYLEKATKEEPDNYDVLMMLADLYTFFNPKYPNYNKAILTYQKAIQIKPDNAELYNKIGEAFCYKKDYKKAKNYAMKAISLNKECAEAFRTLGDIYKGERKFEDALKSFEKAVGLYSKQGAYDQSIGCVQYSIGKVYEELRRYDEALVRYNKAYQRLGLPSIENKIARIYLNQEKYPEAIAIYEKMVKENPKDSVFHFGLADAYFKDGQTREAIKEYEKVLELEPGTYHVHYNLGLAYMKLGSETDVEKSLLHFKKYIALTKVKEFQLKLKELRKQEGNIGALASLLLMRFDYNKGSDQFTKGIKETKYEHYEYKASPDVFVAEGTLEALAKDIKKVKADDSNIQEVIHKLNKAVLLRAYGIKIHNLRYHRLKKDYSGASERGFAKIKVADSYFLEALKRIQQLMNRYKNFFSEYEIELLSNDINYYATKEQEPHGNDPLMPLNGIYTTL